MNMKSSKGHKVSDKWHDILNFSTSEEATAHEAQMLMFRFISEIEKYQELQNCSRKALSQKIKTSPSYITQVFRGDKPLNFETLAKIQSALNITFHIHAYPRTEEMRIDETIFLNHIKSRAKTTKSISAWKNIAPGHDITSDSDKNFIENFLDTYESNTVPA